MRTAVAHRHAEALRRTDGNISAELARRFDQCQRERIGRLSTIVGAGLLMAIPTFLVFRQPDLADLPIEDLRKWQAWEVTPTVLGYAEKESHSSIPIVYRAILKFAIAASWADPKNEAAAEFVKKARAKDSKKVEFLEDIVRDEQRPVPAPSPGK